MVVEGKGELKYLGFFSFPDLEAVVVVRNGGIPSLSSISLIMLRFFTSLRKSPVSGGPAGVWVLNTYFLYSLMR